MAYAVTALGSQCVEVKIRSEVHVHSVKNTLKQTSLYLSAGRRLGESRSSSSVCSGALDFINDCHRHLVLLSRTSPQFAAQGSGPTQCLKAGITESRSWLNAIANQSHELFFYAILHQNRR